MKKVIIFIFVVYFLIIWNISFISASNTINKSDKLKYLKQLVISKNDLKKAKKEKFIDKVDKLLLKIEKDKFEKVFYKITKLKKKNEVIKYLEAKMFFKLLKDINDLDNNINRIYWDSKDNILEWINTKKNIIWWKEGRDIINWWELNDVIIVVWDMTPYNKVDKKQTFEFLWFSLSEINWKNFNINGAPKDINGWEWHDILFITWDIDFSNTKIKSVEEIIIY